MKTKLTLLAAIALALVGCSTQKIIKAAGQDPASFVLDVQTIYGRVKLTRANPGKDHSSTVSPDGTLHVERYVGPTNINDAALSRAVRSRAAAPTWAAPLIVDPLGVPVPAPNPAP